MQLPEGDAWTEAYSEEDDRLSLIENCYCPNCHGSQAVSHVLPTRVPFFREIIVMTLMCPDCNYRNSEVSFGGAIQERGQRHVWKVTKQEDLNRQVIKSDSCSLLVHELELEIPPQTQRGTLSTLEGMLRRAAENLEAQQPERLRFGDVDNFHRCRRVIQQLRQYAGDHDNDVDDDEGDDKGDKKEGQQVAVATTWFHPFTIVLDDPAGNSFVENPYAPQPDPNVTIERYERTPTQDMSLGLQPSAQAMEQGTIDDANPQHKNVVNASSSSGTGGGGGAVDITVDISGTSRASHLARQEVLKFPTTCPNCHLPSETSMCATDIPHFKEVIIMSMLCEQCGYKSNEIKGGGAIPKFGTTITVHVQSLEDLAREVLKSDTAGIAIPELDLELSEGGLDGLYTTVEGLLRKMRDRLEKANPFGSGDSAIKQHVTNDGQSFSAPSTQHVRYREFLDKLEAMANGERCPFTLIISDPLSNSFVGPVPADAVALSLQADRDGHAGCYASYIDTGMKIEEYERSHDQNEQLGLNDIRTENYHQLSENDNGNKHANYGTDTLQELPDRLRRLDVRGPDHPHAVGKAPVSGDTTVMGSNSLNFAVPGMAKRGTPIVEHQQQQQQNQTAADTYLTTTNEAEMTTTSISDTTAASEVGIDLAKLLHDYEFRDPAFIMNEEYEGSRGDEGLVFKDGAQGVGYYTNKPLLELWMEWQTQQSP